MTDATVTFVPRVRGATNTQSPNVESLMDQLDDESYYIPDYQRDSSQWDDNKKSLFIDSIINNMTIPPLIVYPETDEATRAERHQIVDGQQRLTTIRDYLRGTFALASEKEVEYADNVGPIIQGKKFVELPEAIKKLIKRYVLNIIILPKDLDLSLRLEIFRRINEAGVPLSPHDLRLATFGRADRVYLVRLAGVFDPNREGAMRMIKAAKDTHGLEYPWKDPSAWGKWWSDSLHATGQSSSQMFLYYVIARDLKNVDTLLSSTKTQDALGIRYDRTTTSVLDVYAAQLQNESLKVDAPKILADLPTLERWFADFETWFNSLKTQKVPGISPNSATKIALFIAAANDVWGVPEAVTEKQWELIQLFLTQGPSKIEDAIGIAYPIPKGKWPGQRTQIEKTVAVCEEIAKR